MLWLICSLISGIIFSGINKTGQDTSFIVLVSTIIGLLATFVILAFKMVIITSKTSKEAKLQKKKDIQEGIHRYNSLIHVGGLNAPENCKASVTLSKNTLTVNCGGNEFVLDIPKIKNVDFQLDIDEKQYLKSSFTKGVVGAATFGVAGAVIGSAPKTKIKREVKCYAIISYESVHGDYKTFILRDEFPNTQVCAGLVDAIKPVIKSQTNRVRL